MDRKGLIKAAAAALTAQGITAAVSAITVFFLAGSLDAAGYGLWQLFTLAGAYSGLFHLGLCDGVYLRLGGIKYEELDFVQLGRQFRRMFIYLGIPALLLALFGLFFFGDNGRITSLCLALIYMPLFNATAYLGYVLQATGRTSEYSMSTVIDRTAFVILASAAAFSGNGNYILYIVASIAAKLVSLGYCIFKNHKLVFSRSDYMSKPAGKVTASDIKAGSKLLWANMSGQFVSGAARIAIIARFGDAEFGRISFVMTLSGLFLQFAAQLGMVAFPSLRREDGDTRQRIIGQMRSASGLLLPAVFLMYLPAKLAVSAWLPQYAPRINYLALLLPLCLFEGRTQFVNQTFLKVSRLEKRLLAVNLFSAGLSAVLCFFSAYVLDSITAVLICAVISSAARCYLSDIRSAGKAERIYALLTLFSDAAVSSVFVFASLLLPDLTAATVYTLFYIGYIFIRRADLPSLGLGKA